MIGRLARLSAREQAICAFIFLVVCGYLFYTGIVNPQVMELRAISARLQTERLLLVEKRRAAAEQITEEETLGNLRRRLERSQADFFSSRQASSFLASLHTLVESAKCKVTSIDFLGDREIGIRREKEDRERTSTKTLQRNQTGEEKEVRNPPRLMKRAARLTLVGTYPHVSAFLQAIGDRPQLVDVGEVTLELVSRDVPDLNVSLIVSVFSLENEESTGK